MTDAPVLAEVWRGDRVESVHRGHVVIATPAGQVLEGWGDPERVIFPRSAVKPLQALPLLESGAFDAAGLGAVELALATASHAGAALHTRPVRAWLARLGLGEGDLRCGAQMPEAAADRADLIRRGAAPDQTHNNCSGKHTGFLTLSQHLGAGPDYIDVAHPVQKAVRTAFEEMTDETSPGFGIDGCSAPNFACSLRGLARAAAQLAEPTGLGPRRTDAARRIVAAMAAHPLLIAGRGRACTRLTEAAAGGAIVKTGAEGVFVGICPALGCGIALKIEDGATRAANAAMAAILQRLGVLAPGDPAAEAFLAAPIANRRGLVTGAVRAAPTLLAPQ
ncbi:MAG: asparaginase [Pseudomonadota bacterium]